jgi:O-succinylbenzoic acid--CoA ligase
LLEVEPEWRPPRSLRAVLVGGAASAPELLERAARRGFPVLATYGLTEACSQVATQRPGEPVATGTVGRPLPGVAVRIVDGEIQVRGPTLLTAYHPATSSPFVDGGWLRTGDLGAFDADGALRVLGRARELIVTGGENVHPLEVEAALERVPGVRSACVFGVPDPTWGELVAAAVVVLPGVALDAASIDAKLREELASFKRPRRIAFVAELPQTPSGKSDRAATRRLALPLLAPLPRP